MEKRNIHIDYHPVADNRETTDQRHRPTPRSTQPHFLIPTHSNSYAGAEAEHTCNRPSYPLPHLPHAQDHGGPIRKPNPVVHVRPDRTPYSAHILSFPLPTSFSFALRPLTPLSNRTATRLRCRHRRRMRSRPPRRDRPAHRSHHRRRRCRTKAVGQVRIHLIPLQHPRLLVVVVGVDTKVHPHRCRGTNPHCLPARVSEADAGPLPEPVHVYHC